MTEQPDDDALTWAGDDLLQAPRVRAPRSAAARTADDPPSGEGLGLVALGIFGGVAVLETIGWARSAFSGPLAATLTAGDGSPLAVAALVAAIVGHVAAVLAPLAWAAVVVLRVRRPSARLAWLVLGALVLLPWPVLLGVG